MAKTWICEFVRASIGCYGGALSRARAYSLAAAPTAALVESSVGGEWERAR